MGCSDDRGDVIVSGVLKLLVGLLLLGLVLYEGGALVVNQVQLDDAARRAAAAGAAAWAYEHSTAAVDGVVQRRMTRHTEMALESVAIEGDTVTVTVTRPAAVMLLDRIGPLSHYAQGRASSSSTPATF